MFSLTSDWLRPERSGNRSFKQMSNPALGPTQTPTQRVTVLFPGVKRKGRGHNQPPSSSNEVTKSVQIYTPSVPLVAVYRVNFTLTFTFP
jgi:hypothetical protein